MSNKVKNIIKFVLFLATGLFLFWLVYKDLPVDDMMASLKDVDYLWIWLSLILGILSHVSRALRWKMLIKPLGYNPKNYNVFFAVMINYLANLAIPRIGEISRCGVIKQYEKVPFTQSFGTVIIERTIDLIVLFLLLAVVLLTQSQVVLKFIADNPEIGNKFSFLINSPIVSIIAAAGSICLILLFIFLRKKFRHFSLYRKVKEFVMKLIDGIRTIGKLENKWGFIAHTLFIWLIYFLMLYICFRSFSFTKDLSALSGLTVFVMASFGMVAPVQGGIGAWHFMVTRSLLIFGVSIIPDGLSFALVVHSAQTLMLVVAGAICVVLLPIANKKSKAKIPV